VADIVIKIGVNPPKSDVDLVMRTFNIIYHQNPETEDIPFVFSANEDDFTDGAVGVLASMSFILNYTGKDDSKKTFSEHVITGFKRSVEDGKRVVTIEISPLSRKLLRIIFDQKDSDENEEEKSRFIQLKAEEFGLE